MRRAIALLPLLLLAACGDAPAENPEDALDIELAETANGSDPMLATALADPIMVDPMLATRANADAVRPPAQPYSGLIASPDTAPIRDGGDEAEAAPAPQGECRECAAARDSVTLAALAKRQPAQLVGGCATGLAYSARWAAHLPADLPLHPAARVSEAAGNDTNGCALRVVSFTVAKPLQSVTDFYYARAKKAGFTAEHKADAEGQHMLNGARQRDGAGYAVFLSERTGGGTQVELIANRGG